MTPTGPVHFIHLGGEFRWQHWRAVETARHLNSHALPVIWTVDENLDHGFYPHHVDLRVLDLPDWLRDHPIKLANVKDYFMWNILHDHGGMYLDLDTITLRPAWDLTGKYGFTPPEPHLIKPHIYPRWDVVVSREYHPDDTHPDPYNSAVVIGAKGAPVLRALAFCAGELLRNNVAQWGAVGPRLLTGAVEAFPDDIGVAPYRVLNGWSYHDIGDYYANPRDPGEETCVIHLYSSDHLDEFYADRWMP